jgi:O-methyltransferase
MSNALKNALKGRVQSAFQAFGLELRTLKRRPTPEATDEDVEMLRRIAPYTMTSGIRGWTMLKASQYVRDCDIKGDIVECGVWKGGLVMLAKMATPNDGRRYFLYDTFAGLTKPTQFDQHADGSMALPVWEKHQRNDHNEWCYASLADVQQNFRREGLEGDDVIFCAGDVVQTLRDEAALPEAIALLRLDTDFYESSKIELEVLYPRLVPGGVLIIDDYGDWTGQRRAVDEYFGTQKPLFIPIDPGCRIAIKP